MEIIALNPLNSNDPDWETIPESDALFMCYQFLFAARDNPKIHDALLSLAKRMKFLQSGFAGMDAPILQDVLKIENVHIANASKDITEEENKDELQDSICANDTEAIVRALDAQIEDIWNSKRSKADKKRKTNALIKKRDTLLEINGHSNPEDAKRRLWRFKCSRVY